MGSSETSTGLGDQTNANPRIPVGKMPFRMNVYRGSTGLGDQTNANPQIPVGKMPF